MLEYYRQILKKLSKFLFMLRVTSKKDKIVIIKKLDNIFCLKTLELKLKQKHKQEKKQRIWHQISSDQKKEVSNTIHI